MLTQLSYQEPDEYIVAGRLKRRNLYAVSGEGHVDITVVGADGIVMEEASTSYTPQHITNGHSARFKLRFPGTAPHKSSVRVAHHPGRHSHRSTQRRAP